MLYLLISEYHVAHVLLWTVFETGSHFRKMKSQARFSSYRFLGSDFVKTFNSRSRIFKQVFWWVSDFTIHHPYLAVFFGKFFPSGKNCYVVNPMWSTKLWNKTRPPHWESKTLLFATSVWVFQWSLLTLYSCDTEDAEVQEGLNFCPFADVITKAAYSFLSSFQTRSGLRLKPSTSHTAV